MNVVNCFQIVSLRYWWHLRHVALEYLSRCELLSDCIFEVLVTPAVAMPPIRLQLWIAFRLYLWGIGDTKVPFLYSKASVVNCFQIVSLRYWWHLSKEKGASLTRCELLSDCIFEVLVTPICQPFLSMLTLWIAFRLYLWGIGDTHLRCNAGCCWVVNCFQIVSLRYWWHRRPIKSAVFERCELLSDCIFEVLVTPIPNLNFACVSLWIAFRLYLWGIGDTWIKEHEDSFFVVNCFQIVSLRYWWHLNPPQVFNYMGCELLSDCIFEVLVTPKGWLFTRKWLLWIAFRLYLWGIGDTLQKIPRILKSVVNCFQIVSLRYWWHLSPIDLSANCVVNCFQIVSLRYWWHRFLISFTNPRCCELLSDCIFEVLVTPSPAASTT